MIRVTGSHLHQARGETVGEPVTFSGWRGSLWPPGGVRGGDRRAPRPVYTERCVPCGVVMAGWEHGEGVTDSCGRHFNTHSPTLPTLFSSIVPEKCSTFIFNSPSALVVISCGAANMENEKRRKDR